MFLYCIISEHSVVCYLFIIVGKHLVASFKLLGLSWYDHHNTHLSLPTYHLDLRIGNTLWWNLRTGFNSFIRQILSCLGLENNKKRHLDNLLLWARLHRPYMKVYTLHSPELPLSSGETINKWNLFNLQCIFQKQKLISITLLIW